MRRWMAVWIGCCLAQASFAILNIEITQGAEQTYPVAVMPFIWDEKEASDEAAQLSQTLHDVITHDLYRTGLFRVAPTTLLHQFEHLGDAEQYGFWPQNGYDYCVQGRLQKGFDGHWRIEYQILDVYKSHTAFARNIEKSLQTVHLDEQDTVTAPHDHWARVFAQKFDHVHQSDMRTAGHMIANKIHQHLTGVAGDFQSQIAYVRIQKKPVSQGFRTVHKPHYQLIIADSDGARPRVLLSSSHPLMMPRFSPDAKQLAYVSFEAGHSEIYVLDVHTGQRRLLTSFPGINNAPVFSPDGRSLVCVLSKDGNSSLYSLDLQTRRLMRLTAGLDMNTDPCFTPDGRHVVFASDRGGDIHLYQLSLHHGKIKRLTFEGIYNADPAVSPDGKFLYFIHKRSKSEPIQLMKMHLQTYEMTPLISAESVQAPSTSPNGMIVLYSTREGECSRFKTVSSNGGFHLALPKDMGCVQSPTWSRFVP